MKIILLISIFLVMGCSNDPRELNGKLLMDANGKIYQVEAKVGDVYFIREYSLKTIKEFEKLSNPRP